MVAASRAARRLVAVAPPHEIQSGLQQVLEDGLHLLCDAGPPRLLVVQQQPGRLVPRLVLVGTFAAHVRGVAQNVHREHVQQGVPGSVQAGLELSVLCHHRQLDAVRHFHPRSKGVVRRARQVEADAVEKVAGAEPEFIEARDVGNVPCRGKESSALADALLLPPLQPGRKRRVAPLHLHVLEFCGTGVIAHGAPPHEGEPLLDV
mmetsp:Transcript_22532/g.63254  ORF Transcript_22532/g.63254 Transcript_22532/m.63254 type:complete len:205 (-) Transcript_22532:2204-2818(-)